MTGYAQMDLVGPNGVCGIDRGWFTLHEFTRDATGVPVSVSVTFEVRCGSPAAAVGSLVWNATAPPAALPPLAPVPLPTMPPSPPLTPVPLPTMPPSPPLTPTPLPSVPSAPSLDLRVDRRSVAYGKTVTVRARLTGVTAPPALAFLTREVGRREESLLQTVPVDQHGWATLRVRLVTSTAVVVRFAGDSQQDPLWDWVTVSVRPRIQSRPLQSSGRRGRYRTYTLARPVVIGARLLPAGAKRCLTFKVQLRSSGAWRTTANTQFRGDRHNLASTGDWEYVTYTR